MAAATVKQWPKSSAIFGAKFKKDFGDLGSFDDAIIEACSEAMAEFVTGEARVFKDEGSKSHYME